jgi:hypothetical protein
VVRRSVEGLMKKNLVFLGILMIFILSGYSGYSYFNKDNVYAGMTVVPEERNDLPLYKGLVPGEHQYTMEGNHWQSIYDFYAVKLPRYGWKLSHKQATIGYPGGFMMTWAKDDKELFIGGNWNPENLETEVMFDLHPQIHISTWIDRTPQEVCVYADPNDNTCSKITDSKKIEQLVRWINFEAYDKEDAPLQKEYGVLVVDDLRIEVHYDPKLPSYTLKSELGRKQMKPEKLLELTGLTHLREK